MKKGIVGCVLLACTILVLVFTSSFASEWFHRTLMMVRAPGAPAPTTQSQQTETSLDAPSLDCPATDHSFISKSSKYGAGRYFICYPAALVPHPGPFGGIQDNSQNASPSNNVSSEEIELFAFPSTGFRGTVQDADIFASEGSSPCNGNTAGFEQIATVGGVPFNVYDTAWAAGAKEGAGEVWSTTVGRQCYSVGWSEWDFNPYAASSGATDTGTGRLVEDNQQYVQHVKAIFSNMLPTFAIIE